MSANHDDGDSILHYARMLEAMAEDGWCPEADDLDSLADHQQENLLGWIASNLEHADIPASAAEWLEQELICGRHDPAGRLSRALKTGKVRASSKIPEVFLAVAHYLRRERKWPTRAEIEIPGVAERTRDAAFEEIAEKLMKHIDGRARWVDPQ